MKSPLENAIQILGTQRGLADALTRLTGQEVKQAHVWNWLNTTRNGVPGEYVIGISEATEWQVTPNQLRPDLYPHPDDGLPASMRKCAQAAS